MMYRKEPVTSTIQPDENTYVFDQESSVEMARLIDQDLMITQHMGGLFPATLDLSNVHDILDIACGPGGWALEVAFAHPEKRVTGIDISARMLNYARMRANVQGLKNVSFVSMDATEPLKFPDASFDFVNARTLLGFMWKSAWEPFVKECFRILRPGGTIRLTESDSGAGITNSAALEKLNRLAVRAAHRQGRSFCDDENASHIALTPMLRDFLKRAGYSDIREEPHMLNYSYGRYAYSMQYKNLQIWMKLIQPFLVKMKVASQEELDRLYDQMLLDMLREDFRGVWHFVSAIGRKP
ncbi:MAG: methyltransferase domain-containing protein [Ktedonobacteraceae bacterium]|nr:methyltransferase domain-containing protein [Ktedonobacteraceae bacterium]